MRCLLPEAGLPLAQVEAAQLTTKQPGVGQEGVVGGGLQVLVQHYPIGQYCGGAAMSPSTQYHVYHLLLVRCGVEAPGSCEQAQAPQLLTQTSQLLTQTSQLLPQLLLLWRGEHLWLRGGASGAEQGHDRVCGHLPGVRGGGGRLGEGGINFLAI